MTTPTLHLLSRGRAPEHDYRWVAVEGALHPPRQERPPRLDTRAARLVQSDTPSLLIARVGGELVLFVTALETSRTDVQGRPIRNAFALTTGEAEADTLRGLAVHALETPGRRELERLLDRAVVDTPDGGFDVVGSVLERLFEHALPPPDEAAELERRFGPNDEDTRTELAEELRRGRLPDGEGPIVVVTGALGPDRLETSGVWRGLSRLVHAPIVRPPEEVRPSTKKDPATTRKRMAIFLVVALALLLLLSLLPERP